MYKDNIITQLRIKNGQMLNGKKTKHIKATFFFIKDRVDEGEIKVINCPAKGMWVDMMTKPLQGMAFRTIRAEVVNCPVNYEDAADKENTAEDAKMTGIQKKKEAEQRNLDKKMVTWRRVVATPFRTPHECVEHNRSNQAMTDRQFGVSRIQRRTDFSLQQQSTNNQ